MQRRVISDRNDYCSRSSEFSKPTGVIDNSGADQSMVLLCNGVAVDCRASPNQFLICECRPRNPDIAL